MSAELLAAAAAVSSSSGAMGAVGTGSTGGGGSNGSASGASSGSSSSNGSVEEAEMRSWERDPEPEEWEQELQRELLLIQRQQYIQKQLLISEFHKQHQNLLRQHQAQLQEHIKVGGARGSTHGRRVCPSVRLQLKLTDLTAVCNQLHITDDKIKASVKQSVI